MLTHCYLGRIDRENQKGKLPDLRLYSLIYFLKAHFKGLWIVENVKPYYSPLIKPNITLGRHVFWCNFSINKKEFREKEHFNALKDVARVKNLNLEFIRQTGFKGALHYLVQNAVNPKISSWIFKFVEKGVKVKQLKLSAHVFRKKAESKIKA